MRSLLRSTSKQLAAFVADTRGQDLIEYGLLAGIVTSGIVALAPIIITSLQSAFTTWSDGRNNLWIPEAPGP